MVVRRGGRASQMVNLVHFNGKMFNNIMANKFKMRVANPMLDISFVSSEKVVHLDGISWGRGC